MPAPLVITDRLVLDGEELRFSFARSSGPGGQNVNKVNTKAVLRWRPEASDLPRDVVRRLLERCRGRVNEAGELVISSDRHREQRRNVTECLDRLRAIVIAAATPPKRRRPTKPTRASKEARLRAKRNRSRTKANRRPPPTE